MHLILDYHSQILLEGYYADCSCCSGNLLFTTQVTQTWTNLLQQLLANFNELALYVLEPPEPSWIMLTVTIGMSPNTAVKNAKIIRWCLHNKNVTRSGFEVLQTPKESYIRIPQSKPLDHLASLFLHHSSPITLPLQPKFTLPPAAILLWVSPIPRTGWIRIAVNTPKKFRHVPGRQPYRHSRPSHDSLTQQRHTFLNGDTLSSSRQPYSMVDGNRRVWSPWSWQADLKFSSWKRTQCFTKFSLNSTRRNSYLPNGWFHGIDGM